MAEMGLPRFRGGGPLLFGSRSDALVPQLWRVSRLGTFPLLAVRKRHSAEPVGPHLPQELNVDGVTRLGADHRIDPVFGTECCRSIRPIDPCFDPG